MKYGLGEYVSSSDSSLILEITGLLHDTDSYQVHNIPTGNSLSAPCYVVDSYKRLWVQAGDIFIRRSNLCEYIVTQIKIDGNDYVVVLESRFLPVRDMEVMLENMDFDFDMQ